MPSFLSSSLFNKFCKPNSHKHSGVIVQVCGHELISDVYIFAGDLIMWKDVPRSTLWFGAGSFGILSASFMREMQSGCV